MPTLLLDGHNLLYRSFTSLPQSITNRDGRSINGIYGMLGVIIKLSRDTGADTIVAAFDDPETPTFRHQEFPMYQAQRGPLGGDYAEEFGRQIGVALDVLPKIGIPALAFPGYEADDILGTVATHLPGDRQPGIVVSTDRDLLQLVRPGVEVLVPGNPPLRVADADAVRARMGVAPESIPTFKALAGDASDNVPGVRSIGAKTAASLVESYETLEGIYEHLDSISPRATTALLAQRDEAFLFRRITTVQTELVLPLDIGALPRVQFSANDRARSILERFGHG